MRPTPVQLRALELISTAGHFERSVAGWHPPDNGGVEAFPTLTMRALLKRRWVRTGIVKGRVKTFIKTAAGDTALRKERARQQALAKSKSEELHHVPA